MPDSDIDSAISDDPDHLLELCQRELLNKKVIKVIWMGFSDRIGLQVESSTTEKVRLSLGYMDWDLLDQNSSQKFASSYQAFETFRTPIEHLAGASINKLEIRSEAGLSLSVHFDNGLYLHLEPCERFEDAPCWELFCSDGNVIVVGQEPGQWYRQSKNLPYQH